MSGCLALIFPEKIDDLSHLFSSKFKSPLELLWGALVKSGMPPHRVALCALCTGATRGAQPPYSGSSCTSIQTCFNGSSA